MAGSIGGSVFPAASAGMMAGAPAAARTRGVATSAPAVAGSIGGSVFPAASAGMMAGAPAAAGTRVAALTTWALPPHPSTTQQGRRWCRSPLQPQVLLQQVPLPSAPTAAVPPTGRTSASPYFPTEAAPQQPRHHRRKKFQKGGHFRSPYTSDRRNSP